MFTSVPILYKRTPAASPERQRRPQKLLSVPGPSPPPTRCARDLGSPHPRFVRSFVAASARPGRNLALRAFVGIDFLSARPRRRRRWRSTGARTGRGAFNAQLLRPQFRSTRSVSSVDDPRAAGQPEICGICVICGCLWTPDSSPVSMSSVDRPRPAVVAHKSVSSVDKNGPKM